MAASDDRLRELGRVERAELFVEDHGILTFYLHLTFGGSGQGFGGVALDTWDDAKKRRVGTAGGCDLVLRLLDLFKVDRLERCVGRAVYALREAPYGQIMGLELPAFDGGGKLLLDDWRREWFPKVSP